MPKDEAACNFPCPVLSDGNGSSIRYLHIVDCAFRPTVSLGCLTSLTVLHLDCANYGERVGVPSFQLGCFGAVETQEMLRDNLPGDSCPAAEAELPAGVRVQQTADVEAELPAGVRVQQTADVEAELLGESLRLKNIEMLSCRILCYAREGLPSIVPNLETLSIRSRREVWIQPECMDELLCEDPLHLRQMRGYRHDKLQRVEISRFYSSKSLLELTSHILENSSSLKCLTLDTTDGIFRCSEGRPAKCFFLDRPMEAHETVLVIGKYIEGNVPSTVKLNVVEPCSRCHVDEL